MKYQAVHCKTMEVLAEAYSRFELNETMEYEGIDDWFLVRVVNCRKCEEPGEERYDFYGISTGYWCEKHYNSSEYGYRRDAYDPHNEMGTRIDPEEEAEQRHWNNLATFNERFSGDDY